MEFVVTGHGDERTPTSSHGEKDLHGSIGPDLQVEGNILDISENESGKIIPEMHLAFWNSEMCMLEYIVLNCSKYSQTSI